MIEKDLLEKASRATSTDYSQLTDLKDLSEAVISDLIDELEHLYEEFEDYKDNVEENYKPLSYKELLWWMTWID